MKFDWLNLFRVPLIKIRGNEPTSRQLFASANTSRLRFPRRWKVAAKRLVAPDFNRGMIFVAAALLLSGCNRPAEQKKTSANVGDSSVTLYCSVDEEFARPLVKRLEAQTGLKIAVLYDTESTKTAGLANRIRAERARPRCDVYWASALLQTLLLSDDKLLSPYDSPARADLPARFKGRDWTGLGVRARLLLGSQARSDQSLKFVPASEAKFGVSNPAFGTASDWATAYAARSGDAQSLDFFKQIKAKGARVLPGNGDVAREVADGNLEFGWADTDDYLNQRREKKPIFLARTTQDNVLVPGAASLVAGAPHEANAKKLLDALVSREGEAALIQQMPGVFSLREINSQKNWKSGGEDFSFLLQAPSDDYTRWAAHWKAIREPLAQILTP